MLAAIARLRMLLAFVKLLRKPEGNLDEVLALVDGLGATGGRERLLAALPRTGLAAQAFREQPRLLPLDRTALAALPPGTLGREFHDFLERHGLDPADIGVTAGQGERVDRGQWAIEHLRETHDLWHVLTGFDVDTAGEGGLQAFYLAQIRGPLALILMGGILLNGLRQPPEEVARRMDAITRGWAMGRAARPIFGMKWTALWAQPLAQVQADLGIAALQPGELAQAA